MIFPLSFSLSLCLPLSLSLCLSVPLFVHIYICIHIYRRTVTFSPLPDIPSTSTLPEHPSDETPNLPEAAAGADQGSGSASKFRQCDKQQNGQYVLDPISTQPKKE